MSPWIQYWLWVALLTAALFMPTAKLIWTLSVRRLEQRLGREMDLSEQAAQQSRARLIALLLCFAFAALFNYQSLKMATHG
ncbi:MAG: hypothetical protein ACRBM6_05595 [Geminicoccales bacterium]